MPYPAAGQHLGDHLAIGIARLDQGRRDVVEQADQPGGDRFICAVEDDVAKVEQALLGERAHHVVPGGEVVEERSIRDVGALADVFDGRAGHALIQEQVERRTENPVAHLLLAPVHPVHGCEPSAMLPQSLSDNSHSSAACASSTAYGATSSRIRQSAR